MSAAAPDKSLKFTASRADHMAHLHRTLGQRWEPGRVSTFLGKWFGVGPYADGMARVEYHASVATAYQEIATYLNCASELSYSAERTQQALSRLDRLEQCTARNAQNGTCVPFCTPRDAHESM